MVKCFYSPACRQTGEDLCVFVDNAFDFDFTLKLCGKKLKDTPNKRFNCFLFKMEKICIRIKYILPVQLLQDQVIA